MPGSRLGGDEIGIVFGARAREVVVDGEPRYLAFDSEMTRWRRFFRFIECADPNVNDFRSEIAKEDRRATVGTESPLGDVRGLVELQLTAREGKGVAPELGPDAEYVALGLLANSAVALDDVAWRLARLVAHRAAQTPAGYHHGLFAHDTPHFHVLHRTIVENAGYGNQRFPYTGLPYPSESAPS